MQKVQEELRKLIAENPDLPIVAYNDSYFDMNGGVVAAMDSVEINWVYEGGDGYMFIRGGTANKIHAIYSYFRDNGIHESLLGASEDEINEHYRTIPWEKAIIIHLS